MQVLMNHPSGALSTTSSQRSSLHRPDFDHDSRFTNLGGAQIPRRPRFSYQRVVRKNKMRNKSQIIPVDKR